LYEVRYYLGAENADTYFELTVDIDLDIAPFNEEMGWEPIGTSDVDNRFTGKFDGGEFSISNLYIDRESTYSGVFGYVEGAQIENINLVNVNITGARSTGGLAGELREVVIDNCHVVGAVNGERRVGGLTGYLHYNSVVSFSSAEVTVNGDTDLIGGLVGQHSMSSISNCYASCNVNGSGYGIGGLVGKCNEATIISSYYNYEENLVNGSNFITIGALNSQMYSDWTANNYNLNIKN
jgi:hypothetical protein